jgi:capsular exopolysaccharide synthesis family protein
MARESTDIPNLQKQRTVLDIRLNSLTQELQNLRILRAQAEADLEALREQEAAGQLAYAPEVVQALESDPTLQQLRNNAMNLQLQLEGLRERVGPGHRSIKSVETRLSGIRNQVVSREEELTARAIELLRSSRAARVTSLTNTILSVQGQWAEVSAQVRDLEAALTRLEQLATTEENLEGRIDKIEDQLLELRVLAEGERQVELAIPAHVPQRISQPKFAMMIPLGVVLGLGLGFGLAFLLEFVDTSVKSPSDVSRRVNLPLLGMVPHEHDLDEDVDDMRLVWQSHPHSLVGEAFRQIRTCLLFSGPASQRRSLLVTSPMPEDGRTTVALNLAAAIANGGRRVLVVDANFRQPAIQELFPEAPDAGLSNALVGQGDWRESVREVQPNYFVLPAGVMPPNPAELLGSDEMRRLLGEMTDEYDQVLIDGAPCLVVTDPSVLATLVDGVVLTVRAGANTYGIVQRTRDMLLRVGAHVTGVALNGVRATSGGYLRKNYETFYEYHEQPRLAAHRE